MIKQRFITRTIEITDYEVLCVNKNSKEVTTAGFSIIGKLGETHKEKDVLTLATCDDTVAVSILSSTLRTEKYKISENLFMEFGEVVEEQ